MNIVIVVGGTRWFWFRYAFSFIHSFITPVWPHSWIRLPNKPLAQSIFFFFNKRTNETFLYLHLIGSITLAPIWIQSGVSHISNGLYKNVFFFFVDFKRIELSHGWFSGHSSDVHKEILFVSTTAKNVIQCTEERRDEIRYVPLYALPFDTCECLLSERLMWFVWTNLSIGSFKWSFHLLP